VPRYGRTGRDWTVFSQQLIGLFDEYLIRVSWHTSASKIVATSRTSAWWLKPQEVILSLSSNVRAIVSFRAKIDHQGDSVADRDSDDGGGLRWPHLEIL
jgi:hypothetical protein